ncbi:uncharacterized protein DMAD_06900 [Drosophila madeirensis]|uniref:Uncharacterized protein n=1 Tax=Drosophila madeirensis TaxID=30013 RepID=A0AAU9FT91_DROMD
MLAESWIRGSSVQPPVGPWHGRGMGLTGEEHASHNSELITGQGEKPPLLRHGLAPRLPPAFGATLAIWQWNEQPYRSRGHVGVMRSRV